MNHVTQAEFARRMGVNKSTVTRWIQNGRMRAEHSGLIDPEAAARMLEATESPLPHHQARKAQFLEAKAGEGITPQPMTQPGATAAVYESVLGKEEVAHRRNIAVMLEREWTAKQKEIEARRAAGELYERDKVREAWRAAFISLRTVLESLPDRSAPELAARKGDVTSLHHDLAGLMADVLREVSDTFERKLDGLA